MRLPTNHLAAATTVLFALAACNPGPPRPFAASPDAPYLFFDTDRAVYVSLEDVAADLATADVVFFGEFHEDEAAQLAELNLMRALGERRDLVLGLEMFERDVQDNLDAYLEGRIDESTFLESSRPWPNFEDAYRPLVELAREREWPVYATNLPQVLASAVARGGLAALDGLNPEQRGWAAAEADCSAGPYWDRFVEAMVDTGNDAGHIAVNRNDEMLRPMFEAQCSRDEAMAEIVAAIAGEGPLVYHVNGAFHSDFRLGAVSRLLRRRPDLDVRVVSALPEDDREPVISSEDPDRADYFVLTP